MKCTLLFAGALSLSLALPSGCVWSGGERFQPYAFQLEGEIIPASYTPRPLSAIATQEGEFCAVAYNVAVQLDWRPFWLYSYDDPDLSIPAMAKVIEECPVAMVEEIFARYALLVEAAKPRYSSPDRNPVWLPIRRIGQALLVSLLGEQSFHDRFTSWNDCALLPPAEDVDCLGDKGFLEADVNVAPAGAPPVLIHLVNVHFESGENARDFEVRRRQVEQLLRALSEVEDEPVMIGGDFNMDREFMQDRAMMSELGRAGFVEACAATRCGEEGFDKFFVRSSRSVEFEVTYLRYLDPIRDATGNQTSDHDPLKIGVRWRVLGTNGQVVARHP